MMIWKPSLKRFALERPDGDTASPFSALAAAACFNGPDTSDESSAQSATNQQLGVEGGSGGATVAVGAQADAAGSVLGDEGLTTTGNGNHISVTTSDPDVVEAALNTVGSVANNAIIGSDLNTEEAFGSLENVEASTAATEQQAVAAGANTSTAALQYAGGQPVDQAVSQGLFANVSPATLIAAAGVLLAAVYYISRRN
jgi:hypothetical protein